MGRLESPEFRDTPCGLLSNTQSFFRLIAISAALDSDSRYAFCIVNTESASDAIVVVELNRGLEVLDCAEGNAASISAYFLRRATASNPCSNNSCMCACTHRF
jgi:hypothetical protein